MQAARSLLAAGDVQSLIVAAEIVTQSLGGAGGGEMAAWLRETVGAFELREPAVPIALAGLGVPLATTNYDDLLEHATGWERVTWRAGAGAQHALQDPAERVVVHLHGHWREAQSVILGVRSYQQLADAGPAQAMQRAMATMSSLLLVGVGDGASDPNLAALRSWLADTFPGSEMRHFRLCLNEEVEGLSALHRPEERIVAVGYGDAHADLAGFLRDIARMKKTRSTVALPADVPAAAAGGGVVPAAPVSVGRNDVLEQLVARVLGDPARPVLVHGAPGIGKTNLTLVGLQQRDVVARFGQRRWFARCESAASATDLLARLALVLGVASSGDLRAPVLAHLARAPGLLVLDNLETPWEADTLAVEELLGLIGAVDGVALVASVRGAERPAGVRWGTPIALEPLGLPHARSVFRSIAPERFDVPALDDVLEQMGGVPLAIELLAHAAHGEATPDALAGRWRAERARLLQRATADHRLLSIGVSIDTSWTSPLMTGPARQLLSVLSWLPDGVAAEDLEAVFGTGGPAAASQLRRRGLVVDQAARVRTLPPVRHHVAEVHPPAESDWQRAIAHYQQLAVTVGARVGRRGASGAARRLASDNANITVALTAALGSASASAAYDPTRTLIQAACFSGADVSAVADALLQAARRANDPRALANTHHALAGLALARSDHDTARAAYEQARPLYEQVGAVVGQANCIKGLGDIALRRSDHDAARAAYEQARPLYEQVGAVVGQANCIQGLGDIALARSDHDAARAAYEQALELFTAIEEPYSIGQACRRLARIAPADSDRCDYVSRARHAWLAIGRKDLVLSLTAEFEDSA
jgi:tetratricopeptide (TPR) repeat protein